MTTDFDYDFPAPLPAWPGIAAGCLAIALGCVFSLLAAGMKSIPATYYLPVIVLGICAFVYGVVCWLFWRQWHEYDQHVRARITAAFAYRDRGERSALCASSFDYASAMALAKAWHEHEQRRKHRTLNTA